MPRWGPLILGLVVLAEGLGKLLEPRGYVAALAAFRALPPSLEWPVGVTWMAVELGSGLGLLVAGLARHPPRATVLAASGALLASLAYAALTFSAYGRGLEVANCTCFGVYLKQRLSPFVLFQDVYMIGFCGWVLRQLSGRRYRT
jgi:hypothetical protein